MLLDDREPPRILLANLDRGRRPLSRPVEVLSGTSQRLYPLISVVKLPPRLFIDLQGLGIGRDVGAPAQR